MHGRCNNITAQYTRETWTLQHWLGGRNQGAHEGGRKSISWALSTYTQDLVKRPAGLSCCSWTHTATPRDHASVQKTCFVGGIATNSETVLTGTRKRPYRRRPGTPATLFEKEHSAVGKSMPAVTHHLSGGVSYLEVLNASCCGARTRVTIVFGVSGTRKSGIRSGGSGSEQD